MSYRRLARALLRGEPYFGSALRALQGDPDRHRYFLPVIRRVAEHRAPPLALLEIGSWAGASAVSWASALQEADTPGTVTCVDAWLPYFEPGRETARCYIDMNEAAEGGDIFRLFVHNIRACRVEKCVRYIVGDSRRVLHGLGAGTFDLIYIDGSHLFDVVRSDIQHAKRLLCLGGILCGDDLELMRAEVDSEEHRVRLAEGVDYAFSARAGRHYHPGVTEAVATEIGDVSVWNGFWGVQKCENGWAKLELDLKTARLPAHIAAAVEAEHTGVGQTAGFGLAEADTSGP
jgi:predicted O-methyltransferase YrrM